MNDLKLNKHIFKRVRLIFSWRRFWTKNCRNGFRGCGYGGRWCGGRPFGKQLHLKWKSYQLDRFETGLTDSKPVWQVWKLVKIFCCRYISFWSLKFTYLKMANLAFLWYTICLLLVNCSESKVRIFYKGCDLMTSYWVLDKLITLTEWYH
jgi:hypothetical protein